LVGWLVGWLIGWLILYHMSHRAYGRKAVP
jgi:hypothetical protein